jgi:predicted dehydrogenase
LSVVEPLRVGVIGASPERGWAAEAHLPALAALDDFAVTAVCTTRRESARVAAEATGARHALTDPAALAALDDVDIVAVCVKVPAHVELVTLAQEAGKHVYCEWPLTATAAQAAALAARVREKAIVGLQSRADPALTRARELLAQGAIGRLRAAVLSGTTLLGGPRVPQAYAFGVDVDAGMNVLTVPAGHAIDALCACAGEPLDVQARLTTAHRRVSVVETEEILTATAPDTVQMTLGFPDDVVATVHVQGGMPASAFRLELLGDDGRLELTSTGHVQRGGLRLAAARGDALLEPVATERAGGPAGNVARLYRRLGQAIRDDAPLEPDFGLAADRQRLLEAAMTASAGGRHQPIPTRPGEPGG